VRVVIVEDHALLREGLVALLQENDIEVVATADEPVAGRQAVAAHRPDLVICDVRLPPGFTDEGIRMALELRAAEPELGVLVLSQYVEPTYTAELLAQQDGGGVGYLLKERVGEVSAFLDAVRAVAGGGTAIDREVMATLLGARTSREPSPIDALSPREREVLALMAEGRTNAGIARDLVVTIGAVEKHVGSIFSKLDLPSGDDDHRRVLAVLAYLRSA
jgi:DNA-binding NarL/FixJ family response regulator